jgi:hypothetical protein
MSEIDVIFCRVTVSDARLYMEQKIKAMRGAVRTSNKGTDRDTVSIEAVAGRIARGLDDCEAGRQPSMPLQRTVDISGYSRLEQRILKRQRAWFLKQVEQRFPLLDGEHVERNGDFVSYLTRAHAGYPKGTVVLRRTTNRSVVYYIMREAQARPGRHCVVLVPHAPLGRERGRQLAAEPNMSGAARTMADGLAGLLPAPLNVIGASLVALVWPSGAEAATDWTRVYSTMQTILKNGLAAHDVSEAAIKVKGFVAFLHDEYAALKADPKSTPDQILGALRDYDKPFFMEIVNVFMHDEKPDLDVASASLANFMLGANLHIGLNQERALFDPNHPDDHKESGYARTAANLAKTYATYARAAAPNVKKLRMDQISPIQKYENEQYGRDGSISCSWTYWFEDANNGYRSKQYHYSDVGNLCHKINYAKAEKLKLDAQTSLNEYRKNVETGMDSFLKSEVYDVADSWDKIAGNPIPDCSSRVGRVGRSETRKPGRSGRTVGMSGRTFFVKPNASIQ